MAYREFTDSKTVMEDGKRKVLLRKEFICNSFDDLSEIDTSNLLIGSIAYSVSDGKLAVWDGIESWYETDGTKYEPPVGDLVFGYMLVDGQPDPQTPPSVPNYDEIDFSTLTPVVEGDEITVAEETVKMLALYAKYENGGVVPLNEDDYSFSSSADLVWAYQANGAAICGASFAPSSGQAYLYLRTNEPSEQILSFHVLFENVG